MPAEEALQTRGIGLGESEHLGVSSLAGAQADDFVESMRREGIGHAVVSRLRILWLYTFLTPSGLPLAEGGSGPENGAPCAARSPPMRHVLVITLGPVQDFILAARR